MESEEDQFEIVRDVQLVTNSMDVPPKVRFAKANLVFNISAGIASQEESKDLLLEERQTGIPAS